MTRKASTLLILLLALAGVLSLVLQEWLISLAARVEHAPALPIPVVDALYAPPTTLHVLLIVVGVAQAAVMFGLWGALHDRDVDPIAGAGIVVAALVMAAVGLFAVTLTSFDPYAYVAYAKLGSIQAVYEPARAHFHGVLAALNGPAARQMVPSAYGPLWIALDRLVAGHATTLGGGIFGLRLLNLGALAVVLGALALRRVGVTPIVLIALNPAIYAMYIVDAHNDLTGIACVLLGLGLVGSVPLAAVVCIAAAGLMKLPLTAFSLVVFAGRENFWQRLAWVGLVVAFVAAGSWVLGGPTYVHDLLVRLYQVDTSWSGAQVFIARSIRYVLTAIAAIALIAVFARGIVWRGASWSFVALSPLVYPWYLIWSIPYAALDRFGLMQLLIILPFAAALMDVSFAPLGLGQLALLSMLAYGVYDIARGRRRSSE